MPVFAVQYDYAENSEAARDIHRPAHRAFLATLTGPINALVTGPYADSPAGALLIIEGGSAADVEAKLDEDPFFAENLISRRQIREWTQVRGPWAP
jgi:uncharacterized protein YciI